MENKNRVHAQTMTEDNKMYYKKVTSKQWQVYYYLLNISKYDAQRVEDHRYVYKKDLNISQASKFLGISRPTIYSAIDKLEQVGLIQSLTSSYSIYAKDYIEINKDTLQKLIKLSQRNPKNIDILRIYLILKKLNLIGRTIEDKSFTKRDLISLLGHSDTTTENYEDVQNHLDLLMCVELIDIKFHSEYQEGLGTFVVYHLQSVKEQSDNPYLDSEIAAEMVGTKMPERMRAELEFKMPQM